MPSDWNAPYRIDNPQQTERLLSRLQGHLPFRVSVEPGLAAIIRQKLPEFDASRGCEVSKVDYLGDPGGIMCHLVIPELGTEVFLTSITHVTVGPRMPLAREIAAYQKHRVKRLRYTRGQAA